MKKVNECKIIANLLPNYVDHLTDKEISRYIEDHIATCPECAQKLEDMSEKLDIEKEHDERNLRQLKRFRRRIIRFIAMCVGIVIIIATGVVIYNNYKNGIKVNNYTFMQAEYSINEAKAGDTIDKKPVTDELNSLRLKEDTLLQRKQEK